MSGAMGGDDAPLTQALDSFDQLSLRRDRERRRVTEEENAVRCLEELLAEKQRETQQLAREAESRAAELAALERRVPALEDTHHGARRSLQMLTQMRDLLNKQLDFEKRKTEEMLQKLDDEVKEAAARWERYETVYLTMPAYQRKLEMDSLAAEERELHERREQLEAALNSRVSDRDFCVRLAECWRQARLLEGAIAGAGGGGDQSPERENMSGACSQGFGTPRCSRTPSPVYDMETGNESGGAEETAERSDASEDDRTADAASILAEGGDRYQTEGEPSEAAASCWEAGSEQGTPQKGPSPPQEPVSLPQGAVRPPTPTQPGVPSPPRAGASPQRQAAERQTQVLPQGRSRPTEPVQRPPPPAVTSPAPHTRPSPEKPQWSTEPVPPVRRQSSFLIQLPSLYRPSRPRADRQTDTSTGGRTASNTSPARSSINTSTVHRPPQAPSPLQAPQRQPSPATAATAEDVEMTDVQEARPAPVRPPPAGRPRPDLAGSNRGGNSERAVSRDSSPSESPSPRKTVAMEQRQQQQSSMIPGEQRQQPHIAGQQKPPRPAMGQHQLQQMPRIAMGQQQPKQPPHTTTEQQEQPQQPPNTAEQQPVSPSAAAVEKEVPPAPTPPGSQNMLGGRQYWLPMPPDTPTAPPVDERRSFVQRLRQSPELSRRPPPAARKPAAPLEPGLEHQFLRPALPSPHRATPRAAASPQSIFDTPRRPAVEPASPQRPPAGSPSRAVPQQTAPSTPRAAAPAAEPTTPVRPAAAAAGDAPRSMAAFFTSPETDVGEMDSSFSLFGGPPGGKAASPQPPPPSGMSLFGAGDVGGDGDQGADDFSFSFFGGGSSDAEKETSGGGGGVFNFF
ncbi:basic proline-rich protein-like [Amphibalanus amphitrite]|uniref:basic proline-rich protein-like n=1 Tax=Amphibalanus amphitrite TaxID=1232801 RepID=UPI001C91ADCC|nr:basic proline-rich protein-like [Amphibalanus amphitrite]XP_043199719.1 basic proline-rich protein-like [Amphibalanus amphitrite]